MKSGMLGAVMFVALLAATIAVIVLVRVPDMYAVDGAGSVTYQPDIANISVGVQTESKDAVVAANQTARSMRAVLSSLRTAGVKAEDIRTTSVRVDRVELDRNSRSTENASAPIYFSFQSVSVRVSEFAKISGILHEASKAGATQLHVRYALTEGEKRRIAAAARLVALADAIARADSYAKGGQFVRGRILKIQDGASRFPEPDYSVRQFSLSGKPEYERTERTRDYNTTPSVQKLDSTFEVPAPEDETLMASVGVLFEIK